MKKQNCKGCRNDFYNGNKSLGVKECWSFKDAKIVWKMLIGVWEPPPYKKKMIKVPNCYHKDRSVYIKKESLDSRGYWKS